jgi:hypothetical protein
VQSEFEFFQLIKGRRKGAVFAALEAPESGTLGMPKIVWCWLCRVLRMSGLKVWVDFEMRPFGGGEGWSVMQRLWRCYLTLWTLDLIHFASQTTTFRDFIIVSYWVALSSSYNRLCTKAASRWAVR